MFLLLANYLAALFAIQLFRGDIDPNAPMNFLHVGNAFLAMYQILSSENWTSILWSTSDSEVPFLQQWIAILLVAGWLFFANCEWVFATDSSPKAHSCAVILLQMFIALINEVRLALPKLRPILIQRPEFRSCGGAETRQASAKLYTSCRARGQDVKLDRPLQPLSPKLQAVYPEVSQH